MKFSVSKADLAVAVNAVQGAITDRSLAQIGLKVSRDHQLQCTASDRFLSIYYRIECETEEEITCFVPAKLFSDTVKELPLGRVEFEIIDRLLHIKAGDRYQFHMMIPLIDETMWKDATIPGDVQQIKVPSDKLLYTIEQVQFCINQDTTRNYGAFGYFHSPNQKGLRLVGSDGFRLSYCDIDIDIPSTFFTPGICLSKRALNELLRICNQGYENIELFLNNDRTTLIAKAPNYEIFMRLSTINYPHYPDVVYRGESASVLISRHHLQAVTRRVLLAADQKRALKLKFSPHQLTLSSKTLGSSESFENVALEDYDGTECQIAVNGKFLSDVFSTTTSDKIMIHFSHEKEPIVIKPTEEPTSCHSVHVLVPIQENR
jgi:DNA polymerase III beta subunit